jgi:hypothetical protein
LASPRVTNGGKAESNFAGISSETRRRLCPQSWCPADLPVVTTAKPHGLEVPPTLLARADEVIE